MSEMVNIKELNLEELQNKLLENGFPKFHAKQIFGWIYKKSVSGFENMSDLPLSLRDFLKKEFVFYDIEIVKTEKSSDLTEKSLFRLRDGALIEAVIIPSEDRITACLSTQVGCKFACSLCASGILGFSRNLSKSEILEELLFLKANAPHGEINNIVFMGTGEPFDNYDNVLEAVRIINSPDGFGIGARKITISTCGIIPGIKRLADENLQIELSISLHASCDKTRSKLMPVNKKYPIKDLIAACSDYIKKTGRQITFEYALIRGLNSDKDSAQNLVKIVKAVGLAKVNLLIANPVKELGIEPSLKLEIIFFKDYLLKNGVNATLRKSRGADINAACGQLRLAYEKK